MTMKNLYLLLAIIGAIVPWALFWPFLQDDGGPAFIPALFANGAVSGLTFDLVISSGVVSFSPDIDRWVDGLVGAVAPKGTLVVGDIHRDSRGFRRRSAIRSRK